MSDQIQTKIPPGYSAVWIPIESNPSIFTDLSQKLGLSPSLGFQEVLGLDPDLIAFIPRPAHALVLVFPDSDGHPDIKRNKRTNPDLCMNAGVFYIKQTINNACGLYALLHAACNGEARKHSQPDSILAKILSSYQSPSWDNKKLHEIPDLKKVYHQFSTIGDSKAPELGEMVDFHYTCFVKVNDRLVELNGDLEGPVEMGILEGDDDLLSENAVAQIQRYMKAEDATGIGFSMMALCPA